MTQNLYYEPKGTVHFNIKYKGGALLNRAAARDLKAALPSNIEWVWIVEANRFATTDEIRQLCSGTWASK
jgi:hypothetical protein